MAIRMTMLSNPCLSPRASFASAGNLLAYLRSHVATIRQAHKHPLCLLYEKVTHEHCRLIDGQWSGCELCDLLQIRGTSSSWCEEIRVHVLRDANGLATGAMFHGPLWRLPLDEWFAAGPKGLSWADLSRVIDVDNDEGDDEDDEMAESEPDFKNVESSGAVVANVTVAPSAIEPARMTDVEMSDAVANNDDSHALPSLPGATSSAFESSRRSNPLRDSKLDLERPSSPEYWGEIPDHDFTGLPTEQLAEMERENAERRERIREIESEQRANGQSHAYLKMCYRCRLKGQLTYAPREAQAAEGGCILRGRMVVVGGSGLGCRGWMEFKLWFCHVHDHSNGVSILNDSEEFKGFKIVSADELTVSPA